MIYSLLNDLRNVLPMGATFPPKKKIPDSVLNVFSCSECIPRVFSQRIELKLGGGVFGWMLYKH